jgi:hypothetical protein
MDLKKLEELLDLLLGNNEGTIKIINLYLSYTNKLVKEDDIHSFFTDYLSYCESSHVETAVGAFEAFKDVCNYEQKYAAICRISNSEEAENSKTPMVTMIKRDSFHSFIVGRQKQEVQDYDDLYDNMVLPLGFKTYDEDEYPKILEKITSRADWYNKMGTLGKPYHTPSHIWFTEKHTIDKAIDIDETDPYYPTEVRDVLGLIDHYKGVYLNAIHFTFSDFPDSINLIIARPGFADNGNKRFAVQIGRAHV